MDENERLKEIKRKYNNFLNQSERATIAISQNNLNLLIEQSEQYQKAHDTIIGLGKKIDRLQGENIELNKRVRELENDKDWLDGGWNAEIRMRRRRDEQIDRLSEQNKRYCEALENVKEKIERRGPERHLTFHEIHKKICKASEGEE